MPQEFRRGVPAERHARGLPGINDIHADVADVPGGWCHAVWCWLADEDEPHEHRGCEMPPRSTLTSIQVSEAATCCTAVHVRPWVLDLDSRARRGRREPRLEPQVCRRRAGENRAARSARAPAGRFHSPMPPRRGFLPAPLIRRLESTPTSAADFDVDGHDDAGACRRRERRPRIAASVRAAAGSRHSVPRLPPTACA